MADALQQQTPSDPAWEGKNGVRRAWQSIAPVWVLALVGAVLVAVIAEPAHSLGGVSLTLAVCTIVTLAVQLGTRRKEGFVSRVTASLVGCVVILAFASLIFALSAANLGIDLLHR